MRAALLTALAVLALGGCAPTEVPPPAAGPQSTAAGAMSGPRIACESGGGRVERRGRMGAELCVKPFADAGKTCTDSSECQGKCVATGNSTDATAGQCQADDRLFGCYSEIRGGKAVNTICVD